ncbi:hypothetical protein VPH35_001007 [Triticum aestivum]
MALPFDPLTDRPHQATHPPRAPPRPEHAGRHLAEERDGEGGRERERERERERAPHSTPPLHSAGRRAEWLLRIGALLLRLTLTLPPPPVRRGAPPQAGRIWS